jgi:hypothetical protein
VHGAALPAGATYIDVAACTFTRWPSVPKAPLWAGVPNWSGQSNVPALPAGLAYVEVAGGVKHSLARRSDGSLIAWGDNAMGQANVPVLPSGTSYVAIAAKRTSPLHAAAMATSSRGLATTSVNATCRR